MVTQLCRQNVFRVVSDSSLESCSMLGTWGFNYGVAYLVERVCVRVCAKCLETYLWRLEQLETSYIE